MDAAFVVSVHLGLVAPLGPNGTRSAFVKTAASGPVSASELGLSGDTQADPSVHGGPEMAIYAYAAAHYLAWRADYPEHASAFVPGSVGENLPIAGLTEADICVGDVHAVGTTLLQVCQPRQPCFKFALRFADSRLPKAMVRNGRAGWYYRVLRPGVVATGDAVTLHERPNPGFPFARLVELVNAGNATEEELIQLADMPGLAGKLQENARQQLQRLRET